MQKFVYVVWNHGQDNDVVRDRFVRDMPDRMQAAGARHIRLCIRDSAIDPESVTIIHSSRPAPDGIVTFWLDSEYYASPVQEMLVGFFRQVAGYMVVESEVLKNTEHPAPLRDRSWGFTLITILTKPAAMNYTSWLHTWLKLHTGEALPTQSTYRYQRNIVFQPVTYAAPGYHGIIEEGFPMEAMSDADVWFKGDGDPEVARANRERIESSSRRFIDFSRIDSLPMSDFMLT